MLGSFMLLLYSRNGHNSEEQLYSNLKIKKRIVHVAQLRCLGLHIVNLSPYKHTQTPDQLFDFQIVEEAHEK